MTPESRMANEAWEAYFRAQAVIARELTDAEVWEDLSTREYAVLFALSSQPRGLRITELGEDVLLTQPGMSRLIARLEDRGLVVREDDESDARACRIRLSPAGAAVQRRVGGRLTHAIADTMTRALDYDELKQLRDLSVRLLRASDSRAAAVQRAAIGEERA